MLFILFLIIFILFSKISVRFYFDGNIKITVKILFFKRSLNIPFFYKKKEDTTENYVYVSKEKNEKEIKKTKEKKEKLPFPGIKKSIPFFVSSLSNIFGKVVKSFRLEKFHFKAVAASDDSAKTAELYGVLCTAGSAIHQFATNAKGIKKHAVYVEITPNFLAQTPDIYCELIFSIRIFRLLLIGKSAYTVWKNYKKLAMSQMEEKKNSSSTKEDIQK